MQGYAKQCQKQLEIQIWEVLAGEQMANLGAGAGEEMTNVGGAGEKKTIALKSAGAAGGGKQGLWPPPHSSAPTLCWYYNNFFKLWFLEPHWFLDTGNSSADQGQ